MEVVFPQLAIKLTMQSLSELIVRETVHYYRAYCHILTVFKFPFPGYIHHSHSELGTCWPRCERRVDTQAKPPEFSGGPRRETTKLRGTPE